MALPLHWSWWFPRQRRWRAIRPDSKNEDDAGANIFSTYVPNSEEEGARDDDLFSTCVPDSEDKGTGDDDRDVDFEVKADGHAALQIKDVEMEGVEDADIAIA